MGFEVIDLFRVWVNKEHLPVTPVCLENIAPGNTIVNNNYEINYFYNNYAQVTRERWLSNKIKTNVTKTMKDEFLLMIFQIWFIEAPFQPRPAY